MLNNFKDIRFCLLLLATLTSSIGTGISSIAIPWFIIRTTGQAALGFAMIGITAVMFLLSPYLGGIIDRFSRKKVLLITHSLCGGVLLTMATINLFRDGVPLWTLITTSFIGQLYFALHLTAFQAFIQEIFSETQFRSINSIFEIVNQTDTIIAGAVASVLIEKLPIAYLLFINAGCYLLALMLISMIPYSFQAAHTDQTGTKKSRFFYMAEGFRYIQQRPVMFIFLLSIYIPFILVMVDNFVLPVHVATNLKQSASVYSYYNIVYSAGAIASGFVISYFTSKWKDTNIILLCMVLFWLSLLGLFLFRYTPLFLLCGLFAGIGNSGTKITRNTLMMKNVAPDYFGRVSSFYSGLGLLIRTLLLLFFTILSTSVSTTVIYGIMVIVMGVAIAVMLLFRTRLQASLDDSHNLQTEQEL